MTMTEALLTPKVDINAARERISAYLTPTPLIRSEHYSQRLGANVYFKLEMLNPTHSFKPRGALNAVLALTKAQLQRGVIGASAGNHGLGLSYAGSRLGVPVEIYLPTYALQTFLDAIELLGAQIILFGDSWDAANQRAMEVAQETNRPYIHPFDDPHVVAGQATVGAEILDQIDHVDTLVASIGGGGLISGLISAFQHDSPETAIWGVETKGVDSMAQSIRHGSRIELAELTSIAKSLGAKRVGERMFELVSRYVEDVVVMTDAQAVDALFELLNYEKLLVEPATACGLAALTDGQIPVRAGSNVVVVICGANVSLEDVLTYQQMYMSP